MCSTSRNNRGFTLLELTIALALAALLAAALYGAFFSVTRAQERSTGDLESRRELRATLDLIRREIDGANYASNDKRLMFTVEDRDRFGKPVSTLALTFYAPPGQQGAGDQVRVSYRPVERDKQLVLVREVQGIYQKGEAVAFPQMDRLDGFLVECFDGSRWLRTWDASLNGGLPRQVRVTVLSRDKEKDVSYSIIATPRVQAR